MPKTLNIAVIGAGTMAQAVHLPVLRRRWDRFAVSALVDHSERRRRESAELWGVAEDRRYTTVGDLIAAVKAKTLSLDAAVLATDGLHVEDLLLLLKRGIPVLVEPPLGYSAAEVARIADFERMTGRPLVMMAYPQQYDDSVARMAESIAAKDLRMVDHEVLMPASQPLFGAAHVTASSYDLPGEVRTARRTALHEAVKAGSGDAATQRDRDLYVKGLLTGLAHQLAVLEATYGPLARIVGVRHWPKSVIPGSIELWGELEKGAQVRLVWHYLPFAPEYVERIEVLSARRRMLVELPAPSHGDQRSTLSLREKKAGTVQVTETVAGKGSAEAMWEAFHAFVDKGTAPLSGSASALAMVEQLREMLATIVEADGRSIDPTPEELAAAEAEAEAAVESEPEAGAGADPEDTADAGESSIAEPADRDTDAEEPAAAAPAAGAVAPALPPEGEEIVDVWDIDAATDPEAPADRPEVDPETTAHHEESATAPEVPAADDLRERPAPGA